MFQEMSQPQLVIVLEDRPCIHHQPEFSTVLGSTVGPDEIAKPVVQGAHHHLGVNGKGFLRGVESLFLSPNGKGISREK
jgi:hypothetical protein